MRRVHLAPTYAHLLPLVARSRQLQRRIVACTPRRAAGTFVEVGGCRWKTLGVIGEGLTGVTYVAAAAEQGHRVACKHARGHFHVFRELFAAEAVAARVLPELSGLRVARVEAADAHCLIKELCSGSTLQALMADGSVEPEHVEALIDVLRRAALLRRDHRFELDLSPKNFSWDDGWILMDAGEPLVAGDAAAVLEDPSWERYRAVYAAKAARSASQPSALTASDRGPMPDRGPTPDECARRHAFFRDWWAWFPMEDDPDVTTVRASFDAPGTDEEILYLMERTGAGWRLRPGPSAEPSVLQQDGLRRRALEAWKFAPALPLEDGPPRR